MSEQIPNPENTGATGVGLATVTANGSVLDTWFPHPELLATSQNTFESGTQQLSATQAAEALGETSQALLGPDEHRGVEVVAVRTTIPSLDTAPVDAHDAYLRLHLSTLR